MSVAEPGERMILVRRSRRLNVATMGYNSLEAALSVLAGVLAGSIALVGFGLDSLVPLVNCFKLPPSASIRQRLLIPLRLSVKTINRPSGVICGAYFAPSPDETCF